MTEVDLARLQFATTASLHFLFVALTLGLVTVVACMQTRALRTADPELRATRMRRVRFWGGLYVVNYALGIVSGLAQEFQFGLNWSGLSHVMGNIVGAPMAVETIVAFFLESTFLGLWAFGFNRIPAKVHGVLIWLVALTAYASAFWIMVVNGFLQKPVGYRMHDGVAEVTDWSALLTNGATWIALAHIAGAVSVLAGLFLAAVSAYHIRRDRNVEFFRPTLVQGSWLATGGAFAAIAVGFMSYEPLKDYQPAKYALLTDGADDLAKAKAAAEALHGPGDWTPPSWITETANLMMLVAFLVLLIGWLPATAARTGGAKPPSARTFRLRLAMILLPLAPFALICGWLTREVGRQPWMVTGELTVKQAIGDVSWGGMLTSYLAFTVILLVLAVVDVSLLCRYALLGPDGGLLSDDDLFPVDGRRPGAGTPTPTAVGAGGRGGTSVPHAY
ncbi:cytochrome ubiquinol oxidase subunit I [Kitasatospora sp. NPDC094011]|uniref:cytochrome ubiquinol oxidase subunit I n=1 Tax=Kitasatospora sp. NPDC094011 TaxID=3364090 RepID=UPI003826E4A7